MDKPRKQHFLPKAAHLKNFATQGNDDQVWVYQRSVKPYLQNIGDAGALKDLYTVISEDNELDFSVEFMLGETIDGPIRSIMQNLLSQCSDISISYEEKLLLVKYVANLRYRTLSFRKVFCDIATGETKRRYLDLASDKEKFCGWLSNAIDSGHISALPPEVSIERIHEISAGGFWMGMIDGPLTIKGIFDFTELTAEACKDYGVRLYEIQESDTPLFTCDNPVIAFNIPAKKNQAVGDPFWARAENYSISISKTRQIHISKKFSDPLVIKYTKLPKGLAAGFNKSTLCQADKFVFASELNEDIAKGFDSSPFFWKRINVPSDYRPKPREWK